MSVNPSKPSPPASPLMKVAQYELKNVLGAGGKRVGLTI
jgi:hypothetical protein